MSGIIDISQLNTPPEKHELETAKFFSDMGKDIVFLRPSSIPNTYTPDILMDGIEWEMKNPVGNSKRTIEACFRKAVKQYKYIIFDLRRIQLSENQCISNLEKEFKARKYMKRMYIITKDGQLFVYPQK